MVNINSSKGASKYYYKAYSANNTDSKTSSDIIKVKKCIRSNSNDSLKRKQNKKIKKKKREKSYIKNKR